MPQQLPVPAATDDPAEHADWLELAALLSTTYSVSIQEFMASLGIAGSADALPEFQDPEAAVIDLDELAEPLAEAAFSELDERVRACGGKLGSYPFELGENALSLKTGWSESIYVFLMLLSHYGAKAGSTSKATKLFEQVAADALKIYLGSGSPLMNTVVFGFPRDYEEKDFASALNGLCKDIGEGGGVSATYEVPAQKDAKLDIVGWKEFEDRQLGKLIVFGQCATGEWNEKLMELPEPFKWCSYWMQQVPTVLPVRSFFVPHRIAQKRWRYVCHFGGILFDRCRIAHLLKEADQELTKRCAEWTRDVLEKGSVK
jgi:hypothetical protein